MCIIEPGVFFSPSAGSVCGRPEDEVDSAVGWRTDGWTLEDVQLDRGSAEVGVIFLETWTQTFYKVSLCCTPMDGGAGQH